MGSEKLLEAKIGIGGAPTRATTLPNEPAKRKEFPIASGFMDYFPDAVAAISNISYRGNQQHNPGQPLHWNRGKSQDEADTMLRHFLQRGTLDVDGVRHSAKMAWRALALLQKEIELEKPAPHEEEAGEFEPCAHDPLGVRTTPCKFGCWVTWLPMLPGGRAYHLLPYQTLVKEAGAQRDAAREEVETVHNSGFQIVHKPYAGSNPESSY